MVMHFPSQMSYKILTLVNGLADKQCINLLLREASPHYH